MPTVCLFQIDCATNNDAFFEAMRPSVSLFYRGAGFLVGDAPWIPDGVRVEVDEPPEGCCLTLIELEEIKSQALISCRKYLPEDSRAILGAFDGYLQRKISECKSTADGRESALIQLRDRLNQNTPVSVKTACALRSSDCMIEELPLIDQPKATRSQEVRVENVQSPDKKGSASFERTDFRGTLRLDAERAKGLGRCVLILDAVIRHRDHSDAKYRCWRMKPPLKRLLGENKAGTPVLRQLLFETGKSGVTLDCEALFRELPKIWPTIHTPGDARRVVELYFPRCLEIKSHEKMARIFEAARFVIEPESETASPAMAADVKG